MDLDLHTDRLTLTPLGPADLPLSLDMLTDPLVCKHIGGVMTEEGIHREFSTWTRRGGSGELGIWAVAVRKSGEKVGDCFLLPQPGALDDTDWNLVRPGFYPEDPIEVGYALKRSAWGNGYATEICERLLRFAFEESPLDVIVAVCEDDNHASRRVLEKSGFRRNGRCLAYGEDLPAFRVTRERWERRQAPSR